MLQRKKNRRTVFIVDGDEEAEVAQDEFNFVAVQFHRFLKDSASYRHVFAAASYRHILAAAMILHEG